MDDDRVPGLAAETAFFAVLSIFPGLVVAASLLGLLDVIVGEDLAARAENNVVSTLDLVLTDRASGAVSSIEDLFEQTRGEVLSVAAVTALGTLSGAFAVVINALNIAYDVKERRSWIRRRLLGLLMGVATMAVVALALTVLVVGPLLGHGEALADVVGLGGVFTFAWDVLRLPALVAGVVVWAASVFHYAPSRPARWRDALPGALATTVLWVVATAGLHVYLRVAAGANPVLGAFGGGAIVMIWVYLLSLALLLGGEVNATLDRGRGRDEGAGSRSQRRTDDAPRAGPAPRGRRGPRRTPAAARCRPGR
jgi:membrane protein